jgi:hypothetical protein
MLKGIANTELAKFSLKEDKENPTIFYIRNIPIEKKAELFGDMATIDQKTQMLRSVDLFIAGISKIENLDGVTVEKVDKSIFDRFFQNEQEEIINAIGSYNRLGKIEVKN